MVSAAKLTGDPGRVVEAQDVRPAAKADKARGGAAVDPPQRPLTVEEIANLAAGRAQEQKPKLVRTRFAPSPTGHLHIGGGRTALMNYLFAKNAGGEFVLRVEDTDHLRSKPEYTEAIKEGLKWLGIEWNGEIVFQSQRTELYRRKIQELVDQKKAYRDPTGAIYFKMPVQGSLVVDDRVKGRVVVPVSVEQGTKDFVIQRSDGAPTFLLANVVDDGEMGITHVIRGDDHLTNAARQICLFKALGYPIPEFYHVPLIHGDDGAKLSKRHGATSVIEYQTLGYDPLAVANHLARLGMSFGNDTTMPLAELAERFVPYGFSKAPSRIGLDRLMTRNMHQLKKLDPEAMIAEIQRRTEGETVRVRVPRVHIKPDGKQSIESVVGEAPNLLRNLSRPSLEALADAARGRATTFMEVVELGQILRAKPVYSEEDVKVRGGAKAGALLDKLRAKLAAVPANDWTLAGLQGALEAFNRENNLGFKAYSELLRWALTGSSRGVPIHNTLAVIGQKDALDRLARCPRNVEQLRALDVEPPVLEIVYDPPEIEGAHVKESEEEPVHQQPRGPRFELELPKTAPVIERPKDQELVRNGAPIELGLQKETSVGHLSKLKKPGDTKLGDLVIDDFRPDLVPEKLDATALKEEAANKKKPDIQWNDLNDKGKALYLEAHKEEVGEYPALHAVEGANLARVEYAGGPGWIHLASPKLGSVGKALEFLDKYGWGHIHTSFVRGDPPDVQKQQVAWLRNANLYLFLNGLESKNGSKANGEDCWRFANAEYNVPSEEHLELAGEILNGLDVEANAFSKNLQVALRANGGVYGDPNRVAMETRGGAGEEAKARVLDSLMNGLVNGIWGSFVDRYGDGELRMPSIGGREPIAGLPEDFKVMLAERLGEHAVPNANVDRLTALVAGAQFYEGDVPERRINAFDQRACVPLLKFESLPWLTEEEKQRVIGARTAFIRQLVQIEANGRAANQQKPQLALQITQAIDAWAKQALLAEPFGRWLDGPVRRVFFGE